MLHAVILAGGGGTRLWPLSRTQCPKQFLPLLGQHTLLQQTVLRLGGLIPSERWWFVTGAEQAPLVSSQLAALSDVNGEKVHVLTEPASRNTAAAIGLAALHIQQHDPEAVLVILPADHWIKRREAFLALLARAAQAAEKGALVTLGIVPDHPATGYGYIRRGDVLAGENGPVDAENSIYKVDAFVEKPDVVTAQSYLDSGAYYWNAGIFLWKAAVILEEIAAYLPALAHGLDEVKKSITADVANTTLSEVYRRIESVSIDYGVLEKSSRLVVLPADIGWSDLGDWTTLHRLSSKDARGNTLSANVLDLESENSFIYTDRQRVATIGLKNMVVVDTEDTLLICPTDRAQEVKTIVQQLQNGGEGVAHVSSTVQRPWGSYTVLSENVGFKVKRISVRPGASLSLQLHHHRSEQWVVVAGIAQVTNGEQECQLHVGQSTHIPQGAIHRLSNPGSEMLEVIEVQTGSYLGEDDIVRLADLYHRVSP